MRYSVQRVGLACFGVLGTLGLLGLAACPANLENPEQVIAQTATGAGGAASGDMVDLTCVTALFNKSCINAGCHAAGPTAQDGLDLATPGFAARMVDVAATHKATNTCAPAKLIDSANPAMSWLLVKLQATQDPACGNFMPFGGTVLGAADVACVTTFVNAEAAEHSGAGTGTAGAAPAGAAAAGAAAAGTSSGGSGGASAGSGGM